IRIRLVEARMLPIVSPYHRLVRSIAVTIVSCVSLRLESRVTRTIGVSTPGIGLNNAHHISIDVGCAFTLSHRVFVLPEHAAALLHRHHRAAGIHIAALPPAVAVNLSDDLT